MLDDITRKIQQRKLSINLNNNTTGIVYYQRLKPDTNKSIGVSKLASMDDTGNKNHQYTSLRPILKSTKNLIEKTMEEKLTILNKFIRSIRLCIICIRWSKWSLKRSIENTRKYLSFSQIYDFELKQSLVQIEDKKVPEDDEGLSFDKNLFKYDPKKTKVPVLNDQIKRLLAKNSFERTKCDIDSLKSNFHSLKAINSLPSEIQNEFFKYCWLETYEQNRLIIKQDDRAECFYVIINGSLVVTSIAKNAQFSQTICFLDCGQSFGELAIISKSKRTSSILSKTNVNLLVISKEDFKKIFMKEEDETSIIEEHASKTNENISNNLEFLSSLDFLHSWSQDKLKRLLKSIVSCYFPRGQVLVKNTNYSKFIYIIKKGSLSVWYKTKRDGPANTSTRRDVSSPINNELASSTDGNGKNNYFKLDNYLKELHDEAVSSHVSNNSTSKSGRKLYREDTETQKTRRKTNFIKEFIAATKGTTDDNSGINESETVNRPKGVKVLPGTLDKRDRLKILDVDFNLNSSSDEDGDDKHNSYTKGKFHLPNILNVIPTSKKRVSHFQRQISRKISLNSSFNSRRTSELLQLPFLNENFLNKKRKLSEPPEPKYHTTIELMETKEANLKLDNFNENNLNSNFEFIEIKKLEAGSHFGINEILFESQPNMHLISNGCECILLTKELFIQNCTTEYLRDLRKQEIPFPNSSEIEKSYNDYIKWKEYTNGLLKSTTSAIKLPKINNRSSMGSILTSRSTNQIRKSSLY